MVGTFFTKQKNTSKENISQTAEFLNRKPKRQPNNQNIEQVVKPEEQKKGK